MTEADILQSLKRIFCDVFDLPSVVLTAETTAADIEAWDSVSNITLAVEMERAFAIKFLSTEIEELKNVGDLVQLIKRKTRK